MLSDLGYWTVQPLHLLQNNKQNMKPFLNYDVSTLQGVLPVIMHRYVYMCGGWHTCPHVPKFLWKHMSSSVKNAQT